MYNINNSVSWGKLKMKHAKKNKHNPLLVASIIIILILLVIAGGWWFAKNYLGSSDVSDNSILKTTKSSNKNPDEVKAKNELTGLPMEEEYINKRPIGVMINNLEGAQPLLGVADADLIYECPVEGGITRLLAIFKNPKGIDAIGSVRSARPYFINIAQGLDAIYMHIGGSTQATEMLKSNDIDSFSLGAYEDMMWRDPTRRANLGYEHSALTSGDRLIKGIEDAGVRSTLKDDYNFKQSFSETDSQVKSGSIAQNVEVIYSYYKSTVFKYNNEKETYMVYQFDEPQMDDNKKVQNSKQNIIIIRADVTTINNENDLKAIEIIGKGKGQYISRGKVIDIKWSKASAKDPIKYSTTDGNDLVMMPGQSYICVIPLEADVAIS